MHKRYVNILVVLFVCSIYSTLGADGYLSAQNAKVNDFQQTIINRNESFHKEIALILICPLCNVEKDPYISDLLLHEIVNRMGKSLDDVGDSFIDPMPVKEMPSRLSLMARATKDLEAEQLDYDTVMNGERNSHPSMRDQEYLEHSSLFGIYYICA